MSKENKMSISEAARLMGVSPQYVRVGLQRGILTFGYAVQVASKRYTYFISRQKFFEATGISVEDENE